MVVLLSVAAKKRASPADRETALQNRESVLTLSRINAPQVAP